MTPEELIETAKGILDAIGDEEIEEIPGVEVAENLLSSAAQRMKQSSDRLNDARESSAWIQTHSPSQEDPRMNRIINRLIDDRVRRIIKDIVHSNTAPTREKVFREYGLVVEARHVVMDSIDRLIALGEIAEPEPGVLRIGSEWIKDGKA